MVTGATSLGLVRDELFATIAEAEQSLEHFLVDRNNGSLLQQAVESLHQVRGTLSLIELTGAELLAQEMLRLANDIPVAAGEDRDSQLSALSNALYVLRQYLEGVDASRQEIPELLLPAINGLRQVSGQPALPESFFFSVRLDQPRPPRPVRVCPPDRLALESRRMRHLYQLGLLGFLRGEKPAACLVTMRRALTHLDSLHADGVRDRLCWIAAAALEAQHEGQLLPRPSRKQLFARLDRELKQFVRPDYQPPRALLKELLYLVALADSEGPLAREVRQVFALNALPFTDHMLEEESQRLAGPGQSVMRSLSTAIQEELASIKDLLDLVERQAAPEDAFANLHHQMGKLAKTLVMVGMSSAANSLHAQLALVSAWGPQRAPQLLELQKLADAVLYVEGLLPALAQLDARHGRGEASQGGEPEESAFARHQFNEARIVVVDEAVAGLALAKRAISAYIDSGGDKLHLANVPFTLQAVRGGIWFLGQERTAALIEACANYIQHHMLERPDMPSQRMLETLADALTSLEYYLEGSALGGVDKTRASVLDLAEESVRILDGAVAA